MSARLRLLAGLTCIAIAACSANVKPDPQVTRPSAQDRPAGLLILGRLFTATAPGEIVGYIAKSPFDDGSADGDSGRPKFTYRIDFQTVDVVQSTRTPMPRGAEGTRRIYFHADGAHASFADPDSFGGDDPVMTQQVRFRFEFSSNWDAVAVHLLAHAATDRKRFSYGGRSVELPERWQVSNVYYGQRCPQYDRPHAAAYLLTTGAD